MEFQATGNDQRNEYPNVGDRRNGESGAKSDNRWDVREVGGGLKSTFMFIWVSRRER